MKTLEECGRALGFFRKGSLFFDSDDEMAVLMDYCLDYPQPDGRNLITKYPQGSPPPPSSFVPAGPRGCPPTLPMRTRRVSSAPRPSVRGPAHRSQRPLPVRERQEVQGVLRSKQDLIPSGAPAGSGHPPFAGAARLKPAPPTHRIRKRTMGMSHSPPFSWVQEPGTRHEDCPHFPATYQINPKATMASATRMNPTMLAPRM